MERPEFENGAYYHVYNRGTDKRQIFAEEQDYYRFIHYLYVCNDTAAMHVGDSDVEQLIENQDKKKTKKSRTLLVDIIAYALMPNHFHLLVRQRKAGGVSLFIQKVATGYTMYFNVKNKRTGALFQGRFKSKAVDDEQYLPTLVRYIHLNPVALQNRRGSTSSVRVEEFLRTYRWSSCSDYLGKKNFPSVLSAKAFREIFSDQDEHREFLLENIENHNVLPDNLAIDKDE